MSQSDLTYAWWTMFSPVIQLEVRELYGTYEVRGEMLDATDGVRDEIFFPSHLGHG